MMKTRKPRNYWNRSNIDKELRKVISEIGHFPIAEELREMKRGDLLNAIHRYTNGLNSIKIRMGYNLNCKPPNYWNPDTIIQEVREFEREVGKEVEKSLLEKMGRFDLSVAISRHGGGYRWLRRVMNRDQLKKEWDESTILANAKKFIKEIGHFPVSGEFAEHSKQDLLGAVKRHIGGLGALREKLGYNIEKRGNNYWTTERVMERAINIVKEAGYLPTETELNEMGMGDIAAQIHRKESFPKLRRELGLDYLHKPIGYWKSPENIKIEDKRVQKEMLVIYRRIGHFPTGEELKKMGRSDLDSVITRYLGGHNCMRKKMGFSPNPLSEKMSYATRKGGKAEKIIVDLAKIFGREYKVTTNKKLDKGRILELVLEINEESIGIDVTTARTTEGVEKKWNTRKGKQGYQHYLDKLVVIVVSDAFPRSQYKKWNEECPENVTVLHWVDAIRYFNITVKGKDRRKLTLLARCTFYNRDAVKGEWDSPQTTLDEFGVLVVPDFPDDQKIQKLSINSKKLQEVLRNY